MTSGADYRVDLSIYNGPLDLLLHLIREREVDIHDIPITEITEQFLAHLEVVQRIDVERAGDFLLMAATLMLIKSRMLLPRAEASEDELCEELDPRTDLVNQLLEYKDFKDRARALAEADEDRQARFESGLSLPDPEAPDAGKLLEDLGVHDLLLAFEKLMSETLAEVDFQVFGENLPIRDVRELVTGQLRASGGTLGFRDLFAERRDRYYIVSVFCALLEMLRRQVIAIEPAAPGAGEEDAGDEFTRDRAHWATDLRIHLAPDAAPAEAAADSPHARRSAPPPPPPREDRLPRLG